MMKFFYASVLVAGLTGLTVTGCSSQGARDESSGSASTGAETSTISTSTTEMSAASASASLPGSRVFYFDFDRSTVKSEGMALADAWAAYLAANPGMKVRVEGHADERGTREYNMALGERRGNAVFQALVSRGVSAQQLTVLSFGEERPVTMGHDEGAWSQNRRVEIVQ